MVKTCDAALHCFVFSAYWSDAVQTPICRGVPMDVRSWLAMESGALFVELLDNRGWRPGVAFCREKQHNGLFGRWLFEVASFDLE